jgi:hypothetical protein
VAQVWGVLWKDSEREFLVRDNYKPVLFLSKKEAKAWIDQKYGYIKTRKDLRLPPHNWRLPKPVKVKVTKA